MQIDDERTFERRDLIYIHYSIPGNTISKRPFVNFFVTSVANVSGTVACIIFQNSRLQNIPLKEKLFTWHI